MKKSFHLDLREMLPVIRKAYDNKELQVFKLSDSDEKNRAAGAAVACLYAGPCAIGVCIPESERAAYDEYGEHTGTGAVTYFSESIFTCPEGQRGDIERLQTEHDVGINGYLDREEAIENLGLYIQKLEETYLVEA